MLFELNRDCAISRETETALAVCVDGNPYSSAADPDIVSRCSGGDKGRGKHKRSLMKFVM